MKLFCQACHEWTRDDYLEEYAFEKWADELKSRGHDFENDASAEGGVPEMPAEFRETATDNYRRCVCCISKGVKVRPFVPRKRAAILDKYTDEAFDCQLCLGRTLKRSAVRYAQMKWELEDETREKLLVGVDVPEDRVDFAACPRQGTDVHHAPTPFGYLRA